MLLDFNQQIAEIAKKYASLKVPYRHRGSSRKGCDCTGLLLAIMKELGFLKTYKLPLYGVDWNTHAGADDRVVKELEKFASKVTRLQVGNIIVFEWKDCPSHVGIYVGQHLFVHCLRNAGKVEKLSLLTKEWKNRTYAIYELSLNKLGVCT